MDSDKPEAIPPKPARKNPVQKLAGMLIKVLKLPLVILALPFKILKSIRLPALKKSAPKEAPVSLSAIMVDEPEDVGGGGKKKKIIVAVVSVAMIAGGAYAAKQIFFTKKDIAPNSLE